MALVVWSDEAADNIEIIERYIAGFDVHAARRMTLKLVGAGDSLGDLPLRGRATSRGERVLTIVQPYLIRYRVDGETVTILRVRHAARRRR